MAGSGSVPSRKSCMDPVLQAHKKEACSSGPHHQTYWDFLIANRKKAIDRFSLKGGGGGGGGGAINCPKVLM